MLHKLAFFFNLLALELPYCNGEIGNVNDMEAERRIWDEFVSPAGFAWPI